MTFEDKLIEAMHKSGIDLQGDIDWSSRDFQRFSVKNHWNRKKPYFVILTGLGASFGDWRDPSTWKTVWEKSYGEMSREEKIEKDNHFKKLKFEKILLRNHAIYRSHLLLMHKTFLGDTCKPASKDHPYVKTKNIIPYNAFQIRSYLVLPITDVNNCLTSLQFIKPNGFKQFKKHASIKEGMMFIAEEINDKTTIRVCEGWATGCSIYEAVGGIVVIAFAAGNLVQVALALRMKYPRHNLVICADNDFCNQENTGLMYALDAGKKCGSMVTYPLFSDYPECMKPSDFNDLHKLNGLDEVKKQLLEFKKK